jgi:hypothetical protein
MIVLRMDNMSYLTKYVIRLQDELNGIAFEDQYFNIADTYILVHTWTYIYIERLNVNTMQFLI